MLRSLAKTGAARLLRGMRLDAGLGALMGARRRALVLGYHRVTRRPSDARRWLPGMAIGLPTLERQLEVVGRRFRFVSLDELAAASREGRQAGLAAVTFDDGYADVHENAFPLLRRKGIPAAVFVVTDLVGTGELLLHDRLYLALRAALSSAGGGMRLDSWLRRESVAPWSEAPSDPFRALRALLQCLTHAGLSRLAAALESDQPPPADARRELRLVSWSGLREMSRAGVTVGSHSARHVLLPREDPAVVREELRRSREALGRELGHSDVHLAYPGGGFDGATLAAAAEAGYRCAYTICSHQDPGRPELTVPRRMLWEGSCVDHAGRFSEAVFSCQINGVFDFAARCRERHAFPEAQAA